MLTHRGWSDPLWDQLYGPGAAGHQQPGPQAHPAATPQVPPYLAMLQQAAVQDVPLAAITLAGVDATAAALED